MEPTGAVLWLQPSTKSHVPAPMSRPCLGLQEAVYVLRAEGCMEASRSVYSILSVHLKSNLKLK